MSDSGAVIGFAVVGLAICGLLALTVTWFKSSGFYPTGDEVGVSLFLNDIGLVAVLFVGIIVLVAIAFVLSR